MGLIVDVYIYIYIYMLRPPQELPNNYGTTSCSHTIKKEGKVVHGEERDHIY